MSLKKRKNSKKDKLEGAISNELSTDGIMSTFVNHVQDDKSGGKGGMDSGEHAIPQDHSENEDKVLKKSSHNKSIPMIKNPNKKEWWISLGAFATIIFLAGIFFIGPCEKQQTFELRLSSQQIEAGNVVAIPDSDSFSIGTPVYFYFGSKTPLNINKVFIFVENLNPGVDEKKITTIESNINPKWKSIETYFQKEFFENAGKYKISVKNSEKKVLAEKIFYIR